MRELSAAEAAVVVVEAGALGGDGTDLLIVDCDDDLLDSLPNHTSAATWRGARTVGLVKVTLDNEARHELRPHFRLLLNKPVHHRTLAALLSKIAAETVKV
jgi:hypothetical protein